MFIEFFLDYNSVLMNCISFQRYVFKELNEERIPIFRNTESNEFFYTLKNDILEQAHIL